jgi:hypothetical protein
MNNLEKITAEKMAKDIDKEIINCLRSEKYNKYSELLRKKREFIWEYAEKTFKCVEPHSQQIESFGRYLQMMEEHMETPYDDEIDTLENDIEVIEILKKK